MKKNLVRAAFVCIFILLAFTFISQSVYNASLPVVTCVNSEREGLSFSDSVYGEIAYVGMKTIEASGEWIVEEVFVKKGQKVQEGDSLFEVDITEYKLMLFSLEENLFYTEEKIKDIKSTSKNEKEVLLNKLHAEIDVIKKQIEELKEQYPEDGIVRADANYIISDIRVEKGESVSKGNLCISMYEEGADGNVVFYLSDEQNEKYTTINGIRVTFSVCEKEFFEDGTYQEKVETKIQTVNKFERKYIEDENRWQYSVIVDIEETESIDNTEVEVKVETTTEIYQDVIPLSAVKQDGEGNYYIFILRETTGMFGKEYYVKKISMVTILQNNQLYAAIEAKEILTNYKIIYDTSLPIYDGSVVLPQN